jgi:hypothetical protein
LDELSGQLFAPLLGNAEVIVKCGSIQGQPGRLQNCEDVLCSRARGDDLILLLRQDAVARRPALHFVDIVLITVVGRSRTPAVDLR